MHYCKKYRFDNIRQTVASHRDREREKERYMLAANRNMLQQQRANLKMAWKGYLYQHANITWNKFRTLIIKLKAAKRCFQTSKVNTTCKLCII